MINDRCKLHEVGIPRGIPRIPLGEQTNVRILCGIPRDSAARFLGRAEIPFDKNGYISYTAQTGREYFLNLHQKNVPHLRIRLTDQHNRLLCRRLTQAPSNTAAGTGTVQSIDGNLQFSAVLPQS